MKYLSRDELIRCDDLVTCMVCGKKFLQVGSHVVQKHGYVSAREYRKEFGFDLKRGQLSPLLREKKANQARENGTIRNLKAGKQFYFKKGEKNPKLFYERSKQTHTRLLGQAKLMNDICQGEKNTEWRKNMRLAHKRRKQQNESNCKS